MQKSNALKDGGNCIELILNWKPFEVTLTFVPMLILKSPAKQKKNAFNWENTQKGVLPVKEEGKKPTKKVAGLTSEISHDSKDKISSRFFFY